MCGKLFRSSLKEDRIDTRFSSTHGRPWISAIIAVAFSVSSATAAYSTDSGGAELIESSAPCASTSKDRPKSPECASRHDARPRIALALGGGGARGAAHIGFLKVLEENGLVPDVVVGSSMGALVGALYCSGVPLDRIEEMAVTGRIRKAFMPLPMPLQMMKRALKFVLLMRSKFPGIYSGEELAEFIDEETGDEEKRIEELKIPLAVVVVNLLDGQAYRVTEGDLGDYVRASCSLPPLLKPMEVEGMVVADGGIRANLPTFPARAVGADLVIGVNVDETLDREIDSSEITTYNGLGNRLASILVAMRDEFHSVKADLVIQPNLSGISIVSVSNKDYRRAVVEGERAAQKALPELRKIFQVRDTKFARK